MAIELDHAARPQAQQLLHEQPGPAQLDGDRQLDAAERLERPHRDRPGVRARPRRSRPAPRWRASTIGHPQPCATVFSSFTFPPTYDSMTMQAMALPRLVGTASQKRGPPTLSTIGMERSRCEPDHVAGNQAEEVLGREPRPRASGRGLRHRCDSRRSRSRRRRRAPPPRPARPCRGARWRRAGAGARPAGDRCWHPCERARSARRATPPAGTSRSAVDPGRNIPLDTDDTAPMLIVMADENARGNSARTPWATSATRRCSISVNDRSGHRTLARSPQAYLDQRHGQRKGQVQDDPAPGRDHGGSGEERGLGQARSRTPPSAAAPSRPPRP